MRSHLAVAAALLAVLPSGPAMGQADDSVKRMAYWPLDEGTGEVVRDRVGKFNGQFRTRDPAKKLTWVNEAGRSALVFPGSGVEDLGGHIEIRGGGRILTGPVFAVGMDIFLTDPDWNGVLLASKHSSTRTGGCLLNYWQQMRQLTFSFADGNDKFTHEVCMKKALPLDQWVSVAAAYDGTEMSISVDGQVVGTQALAGKALAPSRYALLIGGYYSNIGTNRSFPGKVRNVWLGVPKKVGNKPMLYNATPSQGEPVIDGNIDDACWKQAAFAGDFVRFDTHKRVEPGAEFAVLHGKKSIYIAVRCFQPDMLSLDVRKKERDGWETESLEVFLDPDASGDHYYQIALGIHNTQFDSVQTNFGADKRDDFDMKWSSAVWKGDDCWTAELAIPYSELLVRPDNPGYWHINMCRNDAAVHQKDRYASWGRAPKGVEVKGFHDFNLFGTLLGMPKPQYTRTEHAKVKAGRRKWGLDRAPVRGKIGLSTIHQPLFVASNMVVPNFLNQKAPGAYLLEKNVRYILDVPAGLKLHHVGRSQYGAGGGDPGAYTIVQQEGRAIHGHKEYVRHTVTLVTIHRAKSLLGPIWISSDLPAGTSTDIYFAAEWDGGKQKMQKAEVAVKAFPTPGAPKGVTSSLAWMMVYHNLTWPNFLDTYGKLGFNTLASQYSYDSRVPQDIREEQFERARRMGFRILAVGSPYYAVRHLKDGNSTGADGKPLDLKENDGCPAYRGKDYQKSMRQLGEAVAWMRPDIVHLDIECFGTGAFRGKTGGCHRCSEYARKAGKPLADAVHELGTRQMLEAKAILMRVSGERGFPMPELGIYHNQPGGFVYQDTYDFDAAYAAGALDTCHPVFYRSAKARDTGKEVRYFRSLMKRSDIIPWVTAGYNDGSGHGPEYPSEWVYDYVLEIYGSGARGTFWFAFSKFEASDFYYHAKAFEALTPVSHLIPDAVPMPGVKSDHATIGVTALRNGKHILLLMSDYREKATATVTVTSPVAANGKVWDVAKRKVIGTVDGRTLTISFTPGAEGAHTALYYVGEDLPM